MVARDSFLKTIPQLNSYRNARILTIFEFVGKPDLTYLNNVSLAIKSFSAPKKWSLVVGGGCSPLPATTPLQFYRLCYKQGLEISKAGCGMRKADKDISTYSVINSIELTRRCSSLA